MAESLDVPECQEDGCSNPAVSDATIDQSRCAEHQPPASETAPPPVRRGKKQSAG